MRLLNIEKAARSYQNDIRKGYKPIKRMNYCTMTQQGPVTELVAQACPAVLFIYTEIKTYTS
jgi:hypothetical protein